jgi:hypothetical protein
MLGKKCCTLYKINPKERLKSLIGLDYQLALSPQIRKSHLVGKSVLTSASYPFMNTHINGLLLLLWLHGWMWFELWWCFDLKQGNLEE